jgi:hypothetical protein
MRKLLRKQGFAPRLIVTDKLRSYGAAFHDLHLTCRHEQGLRMNKSTSWRLIRARAMTAIRTSTACFEETRYGSKTAEKWDLFTRELVRLCALCGMPRQQEQSCYGHSRHPRPNESWRHFLVNGTDFDGLEQWMTEGAPCPSH